jgi:hypothetical protein
MHPLYEQERRDFQRDLDTLPDKEVLRLKPREYPGPVTIINPVVIDGAGCTVWALNGPVITCEADGITLRNLRIEVTGTGTAQDHCALKVNPGCGVTLQNVEVRGSVIGLWQEEGDWQYPYSLHIGSIPFSTEVDLLLRVWVPVPCEITSKISGLLVQPHKLEAGANEITLHIERIAKDTLLNGLLIISTPNLKRSIAVSGYISSARPKKPKSKRVAQVIWEPDEWETLVTMPRPAAPTPPPAVPPPARRPRPVPAPAPIPEPFPAPQVTTPPVRPSPPFPAPSPVPVPAPTPVPTTTPVRQPPRVPTPTPAPPAPAPPPVTTPAPVPVPFYRRPVVIALSAVFLLAVIGGVYWLTSGPVTLDLNTIKQLHQLTLDSEALAVAFSPDGETLATGSKAGSLQLWNVSTGKLASKLPETHGGAINTVAFSQNGKLLATGGADFNVIIWTMDQIGQIKSKTPLREEVTSVAFSPDNATLACGSKDGSVRFLDTKNGQQQSLRLPHGSPVRAIAFSADGKLIATGAEEGSVKIWEATSGGMKQQLSPKHDGAVLALAFANNDPNLLATGGADARLFLWDLQKGQMKHPSPFPHTDQVTSVVFSPDDKIIGTAGGGRDTTIRFWSPEESRVKKVLVNHDAAVNAVAISSEAVVASGSDDKTVRLWGTQ